MSKTTTLGVLAAATLAIAMALTVNTVLVTPAKAITLFKTHGVGASAAWPTLSLLLVKDNSGTSIIVSTADGYFGEKSTTANIFQTTPRLTTAILSPVTVHVTCITINCVLPPKDLTIQATWTAFGAPMVSTGVTHIQTRGVEVTSAGPTTTVFATATGTSNGQDLGQSDPANTFIFKFASVAIFTQ